MCLNIVAYVVPFYSICNMVMFLKSYILTFWRLREGIYRQNSCYLVDVCVISFNLICNITNSEKVQFWPLPHLLVLPVDRTQAFELKSRLICLISIVPLSACEISVKILKTN